MGRHAIFFPLLLAALLAILTYWINHSVEEGLPKPKDQDSQGNDYTLKNFVAKKTDETGALQYVLAATGMQHFPANDSTTLQQPRFTQYTTNAPYMLIEAAHGFVSSNGEEVKLVDNVKAVRQAFADKGEMQLFTDKLNIYPKLEIAKTDSPVRILQLPKTMITATGMVFDKKEQTITLTNRVHVHYEKPAKKSPGAQASATQ